MRPAMTLGTSLLLIAVGAILKFAVTADVSWIDIQTVGVILMVIGVVGAIASLVWMFGPWRRRAVDQTVVRDRY
jgi:hypothetical protein